MFRSAPAEYGGEGGGGWEAGPAGGNGEGVTALEETVDEKREPEEHEEPAHAQTDAPASASIAEHQHQPEADAHQRHAGAPVTFRRERE